MAAWEMKRARARDKANLFVMQCRQEKAQREASFTNEKVLQILQ